MNDPRCSCGWHLRFIRKPGQWVAFCWNPSCRKLVIEP